jgi:hypothetical protein
MSRRRFVLRNDVLVELDLDAPLPPRLTPYIMGDIQPYRSVITREPITSRSEHRAHLRQHGMIEVGNEMPRPSREPLPAVRSDVAAAFEASSDRHAEARAANERANAVKIEGKTP